MVGDELEKNWKETYGFDHASYLEDSSKVSCNKNILFISKWKFNLYTVGPVKLGNVHLILLLSKQFYFKYSDNQKTLK